MTSRWGCLTIMIRIRLEILYDVGIVNPQKGDILYYDGDVWINQELEESSGGDSLPDQTSDFTGDSILYSILLLILLFSK